MTPKGTFAALPVRAQAYIIQLYEDTCNGACQKPRYWHAANMLNYHHGLNTVSSLSVESYWFSLKRRNPTIDELLENVFSAGEPLTILQVPYRNDGVNSEVFSKILKYFLAARHPLSMKIFTVACFCHRLEWPEALGGLVRPCPKCSDYRLTKDSGQELCFDSRPTAYEAFHFHNKAPPEHPMVAVLDRGVATVRFRRKDGTDQTSLAGCNRAGHLRPPDEIRAGDGHFDYNSVPTLDIRSKSPAVTGMDPVIRTTISDHGECVSADASLLLRNAYVERLQIRSQAPEAQSKVSDLLRKAINSGDLIIGEFVSYDEHVLGHGVDTVDWLVATRRLRMLTLSIMLASFAQNYARIFGAAAMTTVKHLYVDIFREFGARKQPEEAQLEPATFLAIRERWLDFVFTSLCDYAIVLVRNSLPVGLPCPFSPNDIVRRFLDVDRIDHFTICVIDGTKGGPPEACTAPVAKRQTFANHDFMRQINRGVGGELYDVYYVRNDRAGATLSVLVGHRSWSNRVILIKGALECGDEVPYPSTNNGEVTYDDDEQNDDDEEEKAGDDEGTAEEEEAEGTEDEE
ncbi:hypothetical protein AAVH_29565 [Aphelenchoides avenae]|nr:hypothetical protein AAVH_29565 [Aphelenchus avenae]